MNVVTHLRPLLRVTAVISMVFVLFWAIVPEAYAPASTHLKYKPFSSVAEQVILSVDASKFNGVSTALKVAAAITSLYELSWWHSLHTFLKKGFLVINFYERNSFYTYTTIHAP